MHLIKSLCSSVSHMGKGSKRSPPSCKGKWGPRKGETRKVSWAGSQSEIPHFPLPESPPPCQHHLPPAAPRDIPSYLWLRVEPVNPMGERANMTPPCPITPSQAPPGALLPRWWCQNQDRSHFNCFSLLFTCSRVKICYSLLCLPLGNTFQNLRRLKIASFKGNRSELFRRCCNHTEPEPEPEPLAS